MALISGGTSPGTKKYQSEGGPGIVDIMAFLDGSDDPENDRKIFIRTQLVFFLLGAADGHAKNFSIYSTESGFQLTPLYDILSMTPALHEKQVRHKDYSLAMSVGTKRHYKIKEIQLRHWFQTAKVCGFPEKELESIIEDLDDRVGKLKTNAIKLPKGFPAWIYDSILKGVNDQLGKIR